MRIRTCGGGRVMVAMVLAALAGGAAGENRYWTHPGEGSWADSANWGGAEPTMGDVAYIQNSGTAVCAVASVAGQLMLGEATGGNGTIRLDDPAASLTVSPSVLGTSFYWGRRSTGTVVQTSGMLTVSNSTQMGYFASGLSKYVISGGTGIFMGPLVVGNNQGNGLVLQSGGLVQFKGGWTINTEGQYELTGGTLDTAALTLTITGGRLLVDGPSAVMNSTAGALVYVNNSTSVDGAVLDIRNGLVTNLGFNVGHQRRGTVNQTGGLITQPMGRLIALGTYSSGVGIWNLHGGTLALGKHATTAYLSLQIGSVNNATGTFYMGSATGCGVLTQQVAGSGMYVGNGGIGEFVGWSDGGAGNRFFLTGASYLNRGRVIADGYGTDRALDITSLASLGSTVNNARDGTFGCYARNRGELRLPRIAVSGNNTYYWGEQGSLDLVNAARLAFTGASGTLTGRLYAADHGAVPPTGAIQAVSIHDFTVGSMTACTLAIRYDHAAAAELPGADEARLNLYRWNGGAWVKLASSVDTTTRTITAAGLTQLGRFMIGMPTPGTILFIQ